MDPGSTVVSVVIASKGRPGLLAAVVRDVERQTLLPSHLVVSVPGKADLPAELPSRVKVVNAEGAAAQRNAGISATPDATHAFFFDDDSVLREDYLENAMRFFHRHESVVAITGRVLIDGAAANEVSQNDAEQLLAIAPRDQTHQWDGTRELYGCNFAYRLATGEKFDERLPLYSWLEDYDLARRLSQHGQLARLHDCVIVHRGVKSGGRTAHRRLGYSQVMNPVYLYLKGSFSLRIMLHEILPRALKNLALSVFSSEKSWRRKRVSGNAIALYDIFYGRITPERIVTISDD